MRSNFPASRLLRLFFYVASAAPAIYRRDGDMQTGDLIFSGSLKFNALDQCLDLNLQYAGHIESLTQVSPYCRYYNTTGCSGAPVFAHNSAVQDLTDTDAQSLFTDAKSVYCLDSADVKEPSNHVSAGIASSPRDVEFASKYDFKGVKYSANAMNHCEALSNSVAGKVQSMAQFEGAFCSYYSSKDCAGSSLFDFDSTE